MSMVRTQYTHTSTHARTHARTRRTRLIANTYFKFVTILSKCHQLLYLPKLPTTKTTNYQLVHQIVIGSPISVDVANLVIEDFES